MTVSVSQMDAGLESLKDLVPLLKHQQFEFLTKSKLPVTDNSNKDNEEPCFINELVLHSNHIKQLDASVLSLLKSLRKLDLSSNQVRSVEFNF
jgi:Leucine-rich repeat (LRR) protein